ncbi:MAG: DUF882 domain-containing protein [Myxococcales bacterium]|nr:DUF882 domain-containing protein [Myxococcales bacterium]
MKHLLLGLSVLLAGTALAVPVASAPATRAASSTACSASKAPAKKSPARRPSNGLTPAYRKLRALWHMAPPPAVRKKWLAEENPPLVIKPIHANVSFELRPDPETGTFGEEAMAAARAAFHWKADGSEHPIDERLLELLYRAVKRYKAPYVHLVSGYRNRNGRSSSRHNQGRAADVVLPGVGDAQLAAFFRRQGFVGVGLYPVSGFTHVDVRDRSYFWVDRSGPGQRGRERAILGQEAALADAKARKRGERPTPPYRFEGAENEEEVLAVAETPSSED